MISNSDKNDGDDFVIDSSNEEIFGEKSKPSKPKMKSQVVKSIHKKMRPKISIQKLLSHEVAYNIVLPKE